MAQVDKEFKKLVEIIYGTGYEYDDPYRKGVKRIEISTYPFKHDLTLSFPAITTKQLWMKGVIGELIWFLRGNTEPKFLIDNGINIWNKDGAKFMERQTGHKMTEDEYARMVKQDQLVGDLGRVYGAQWRKWLGFRAGALGKTGASVEVDQIERLIHGMKTKPLATDLLVTAWNPSELTNMALPPCHFGFQVVGRPLKLKERVDYLYNVQGGDLPGTYTAEEMSTRLNNLRVPKYGFTLVWDQRSVDAFLGLPFNIASYALLAHILGKLTNMIPLAIEGNLRNVHLYDNSLNAVRELLSRDPSKYENVNLKINETTQRVLQGEKRLDEKLEFISIGDFKLNNYKSYPPLKVEMLSRD